MSDITIADFWGIERVDANLDNNIGTSMILLNSKKGEVFFELFKNQLEWKETEFDSILPGNIALMKSISLPSISRNEFFIDLDRFGFDYVTDKYFPLKKMQPIMTIKGKLKKWVKDNILSYYRSFKKLGFSFKSCYNFVKINFRKNTKSSIKDRCVLYTMPSAVFDIHPTAQIEIELPFTFGHNPIKGMKMPTCLRMTENTKLKVHDGPLTRYGSGSYNMCYGAYIEIVNGGSLIIGQGACNVGLTIMCAKSIEIGNGVRIGRNVSIRDYNGSHVIVNDTYVNHASVKIEDHVWLCSGCTILPGVVVGEGSVVAANSVVTKSVPPRCLVAGSPAKVIKENIEWY
jgi:acetyltransferase-like isoleucine patch superfamily enzyme